MKYFGTDGIRGIVGDSINEKLLKKIAKAIVQIYKNNNLNPQILVGHDTRISSDYIFSVIESVLLKHGIHVHNVSSCSSPCLAYLTKKYNYPLGLMISASHNTKEYNGIKFFNSHGEKVSDDWEQNFEILMDKHKTLTINYAKTKNVEHLKDDYINFLKSKLKNKQNFIFDCSNGGTSEIVKKVFINSLKINCKPNGFNINHNCGCTCINFLKLECVKNRKIGFAFDGDGDRIAVVDEFGEVYEGDKILNILSGFYQTKGDVLVGTIYTNSGLEKALLKRGIKLIRAQVGDKKVYAEMGKNNAILGGEESGHIIVKPFSNTGDGILNAIIIANILKTTNKPLKELCQNYSDYFQARENLSNIENFKINETLSTYIKTCENQDARIIIRASGTEPVLRLFVEHKNKEIALEFLKNIKNLIKNEENS